MVGQALLPSLMQVTAFLNACGQFSTHVEVVVAVTVPSTADPAVRLLTGRAEFVRVDQAVTVQCFEQVELERQEARMQRPVGAGDNVVVPADYQPPVQVVRQLVQRGE